MENPIKSGLTNCVFLLLSLLSTAWTQVYYQDFDKGTHDLKSLGYTGFNWCTDSGNGNWYMKSPCSTRERNDRNLQAGIGFVQSNRFQTAYSNKTNKGFTIQFGAAFPEICVVTECKEDEDSKNEIDEIEAQCMGYMDGEVKYMKQMTGLSKGKTKEVEKSRKYLRKWLTSEKMWVGMMDARTSRPLYTLLFIPNRLDNVGEPNVILQNLNGMTTASGSTGTVTPRGKKDASIAFKIAVTEDTLKVYYGDNGAYQAIPVIAFYIGRQKIEIGKIFFVYQRGKCKTAQVWIDNIFVTNNNAIVHTTDSAHTFSKALYASDGNNLRDTFKVEDLRQSAYQLAKDTSGDARLPNWFEYANTMQTIASATDNINGISLIIAYAKFYSLTQGNEPEQRTFFMATAGKDTTHSRKVNFVFAYGSEFSTHEDAIKKVSLEIEGKIITIDSATSTGAYQFSIAGEKTIKARVQFETSFIGYTLSKLFVKPMNDGTWYNDN